MQGLGRAQKHTRMTDPFEGFIWKRVPSTGILKYQNNKAFMAFTLLTDDYLAFNTFVS